MTDPSRLNVRATLTAKIRKLQQINKILHHSLKSRKENERQLQVLTDELYEQLTPDPVVLERSGIPKFDGITFIIAAYNMERQLVRTLKSLTPYYQEAEPQELEIIIVDNGSTPPLTHAQFRDFPRVTKVLRVDGKPSPVFGLNQAIEHAQFSNVALMIDGAHMLSPGVFKNAKAVLQMLNRPVINVPQYLLGDISQNLRRSAEAYEREEAQLRSLNWPARGYSLFEYALVAGEAIQKDYQGSIESNCLITTKEVLRECGAFDERFDEPGAGLANIEIFLRLRHFHANQYVVLPGEGTFHQDHSGTTTGVSRDERMQLVDEYTANFTAITGNETVMNARPPFYYGIVRDVSKSVPTISRDFGEAKGRILQKLADIYVHRAETGQQGPVPMLTLNPRATEHDLRAVLPPLGQIEAKAKAQGASVERLHYRNVLVDTHKIVKPQLYLEIGIDRGDSLALASCQSIGIDPTCEISTTITAPARIFRMESDVFFGNRQRCENIFQKGIDLSYIDGMHLAEYVVRDFMNVERWSAPRGVAMIDDCYPEQLEMAERERRFTAWCGDVYKFLLILQEYRPDLRVYVFEAFAGPYRKGIAYITGLDPKSTVLYDHYDQIEADIFGDKYHVRSIAELEERIAPTSISKLEEVLSARP